MFCWNEDLSAFIVKAILTVHKAGLGMSLANPLDGATKKKEICQDIYIILYIMYSEFKHNERIGAAGLLVFSQGKCSGSESQDALMAN